VWCPVPFKVKVVSYCLWSKWAVESVHPIVISAVVPELPQNLYSCSNRTLQNHLQWNHWSAHRKHAMLGMIGWLILWNLWRDDFHHRGCSNAISTVARHRCCCKLDGNYNWVEWTLYDLQPPLCTDMSMSVNISRKADCIAEQLAFGQWSFWSHWSSLCKSGEWRKTHQAIQWMIALIYAAFEVRMHRSPEAPMETNSDQPNASMHSLWKQEWILIEVLSREKADDVWAKLFDTSASGCTGRCLQAQLFLIIEDA
jgi:hypothetical protein